MTKTLEEWVREYLDEWGRVAVRVVIDERDGKLHAYLHVLDKDCESLDRTIRGDTLEPWES